MNAATRLIDANGSSTVVSTCTPTRAIEVSARFRCRPAVTRRGHRADPALAVPTTPSITVPVSRTRATSPVARVEYHSSVDPDVNGAPRRCPALIETWSFGHDPPEETTGGALELAGGCVGGARARRCCPDRVPCPEWPGPLPGPDPAPDWLAGLAPAVTAWPGRANPSAAA